MRITSLLAVGLTAVSMSACTVTTTAEIPAAPVESASVIAGPTASEEIVAPSKMSVKELAVAETWDEMPPRLKIQICDLFLENNRNGVADFFMNSSLLGTDRDEADFIDLMGVVQVFLVTSC